MIELKKPWLSVAPLESVTELNKNLCQEKELAHEPGKKHEQARKLWDASCAKPLSLKHALATCRECNRLAPFLFYNGNTFAAIGKTLVEDLLKPLPPLEAHIIQNTTAHYIAGVVTERELKKVWAHFDKALKNAPRAPLPPKAHAPHAAPAPVTGSRAMA